MYVTLLSLCSSQAPRASKCQLTKTMGSITEKRALSATGLYLCMEPGLINYEGTHPPPFPAVPPSHSRSTATATATTAEFQSGLLISLSRANPYAHAKLNP